MPLKSRMRRPYKWSRSEHQRHLWVQMRSRSSSWELRESLEKVSKRLRIRRTWSLHFHCFQLKLKKWKHREEASPSSLRQPKSTQISMLPHITLPLLLPSLRFFLLPAFHRQHLLFLLKAPLGVFFTNNNLI